MEYGIDRGVAMVNVSQVCVISSVPIDADPLKKSKVGKVTWLKMSNGNEYEIAFPYDTVVEKFGLTGCMNNELREF